MYLKLSPNTEPCPFNYQQKLVGRFHHWLGQNDLHDNLSLYSLSWLSSGKASRDRKHLEFKNGAFWFVGAADGDILRQLADGVMRDQEVAFGMRVEEVLFKEAPDFKARERFRVASPILVKGKQGNKTHHYRFDEPFVNAIMTQTLQKKMAAAGLGDKLIQARFDDSFQGAKQKVVNYKGIENKANVCPVILEGDPEAIAFAWSVGVGHSTGIGFGALGEVIKPRKKSGK